MRTPAFGQPSGQSAPLGSQANHHGIGRWLAPLVLLVLTGCVQVELYKLPVTSVKAMQPEGPGIAPGASSPIAVVATTKDGKEYVTKGRGMNGVPWSDYSIEANVVKLDGKGNVTLPSDPRESQGRLPHLRITGVGHPDIHADLDIPVRYDWNFQADFSGQDGFRGSDGRDGLSGSDGSSGSTDLEHPSSGGNGSDGGDGSNGDDGGTGGHGSDVHIWVALKNDGTPLLQVKVAGAGREQLFLVNPQGGSLLVKSNGGDGGPGGHGGRIGLAQRQQRHGRRQWQGRRHWLGRNRRQHHRVVRSPGETVPRSATLHEQGRRLVREERTAPRIAGGDSRSAVVSSIDTG